MREVPHFEGLTTYLPPSLGFPKLPRHDLDEPGGGALAVPLWLATLTSDTAHYVNQGRAVAACA